jgi:hypothetical protein
VYGSRWSVVSTAAYRGEVSGGHVTGSGSDGVFAGSYVDVVVCGPGVGRAQAAIQR